MEKIFKKSQAPAKAPAVLILEPTWKRQTLQILKIFILSLSPSLSLSLFLCLILSDCSPKALSWPSVMYPHLTFKSQRGRLLSLKSNSSNEYLLNLGPDSWAETCHRIPFLFNFFSSSILCDCAWLICTVKFGSTVNGSVRQPCSCMQWRCGGIWSTKRWIKGLQSGRDFGMFTGQMAAPLPLPRPVAGLLQEGH